MNTSLKNQSGDGSLQFAVDYGRPLMSMTINRHVQGGVFHADEIDETAYLDLDIDLPVAIGGVAVLKRL